MVRLIYERGLFGPEDTRATAAALFLYSFGLVGYTGVKVIAPAFYALHRPRLLQTLEADILHFHKICPEPVPVPHSPRKGFLV